MKFFIPGAKDENQQNEIYNAIIKFAEEQSGWKVTDRKIYSIKYKHDGNVYLDVVGKHEVKNGREDGEIVFAILKSEVTYLVCTPHRCVLGGVPIYVGENDVISVEDFDE
ncbi:MAG: hypothetical protein AB2L26_06780 [Ignavibacteria bacterium]